MNTVLLVVIGVVAFAVGFAIKGSSSHKAGHPAAGKGEDFTFKGHLTVYYKGDPTDKKYRKRPKKSIKVLYKKVDQDQWGSVTFANKTEERIRIKFDTASPFADRDFYVDPGTSSGPKELTTDPGAGKEDDFDFDILFDDGTTLDPGVKVRRG